MDPTTKRIIRAIEKSPNCNKEKTTGNNVANKEPMVGMKFKRNIRNAQKIAKLRSQKEKTKKRNNPVIKLDIVLIPKYLATDHYSLLSVMFRTW